MKLSFGNPDEWGFAKEGAIVLWGSDNKVRKVRVEVTVADAERFALEREDCEPFPLGEVNDHGVIEFHVKGECKLICGGPFHYRTADGQRVSASIPEARSFTTIANRKARNPELELMEYMARVNMEKRFARLADELERKYAEREVAAILGEDDDDDRSHHEENPRTPSEPKGRADDDDGDTDDDGSPEAPAPSARKSAGDRSGKRSKSDAGPGVSEKA